MKLTLTATDSRGLTATASVTLEPIPVDLTITSNPPGISLGAGFVNAAAPFDFTAIEGSGVTLAAPEKVEVGGEDYAWDAWSDGGARVHTIVASPATTAYTATYLAEPPGGEEPIVNPPAGGGTPAPKPPVVEPPSPGPPQTLLQKHPPQRTAKRRARFGFTASDPAARLECRLDGAGWRDCRSPRTYAGLGPGRHSFQAVAIGPEGQYDPTPVTFRWKVLR